MLIEQSFNKSRAENILVLFNKKSDLQIFYLCVKKLQDPKEENTLDRSNRIRKKIQKKKQN